MKRASIFGMRLLVSAAIAALTLSGCVDDAGLHLTATPTLPAADALTHTIGSTATAGTWPTLDWIKRYQDPQLDELVDEALKQNPDLQIARTRIDSAQSQLDQFASLTGLSGTTGATAGRTRLPRTPGVANVTVGGQQVPVELFSDQWASPSAIAAGLNYEVDLWGKNAAAKRGLQFERDAARVDAEEARLTLTVTLVTLYCELDQAFQIHDLLQQEISDNGLVDAVLTERAARGIDNAYDSSDALIKHNQLLTQVELNSQRIKLTELQLGALTGRGPERGLSLKRPQLAASTVSLPANLPLDLIGRRPDIVAARLRVQATLAQIDVTKAKFYPDVNLSAVVGLTALNLGSLLSIGSLTGSIAPAISLPLFDRGRLHAQLGSNYADADAAIDTYNKTVDAALGDVAKQITSIRSTDTLVRQQAQTVTAALKIVAIAEERHRLGIGTQQDMMQADLSLLDERSQQIQLNSQQRILQINLIGALGGGFDAQHTVESSSSSQPAFLSDRRLTDTHLD